MEREWFNIKFQKRIIKFRVSMREKYQLQVFIKDWKEKYGLHTTTFRFKPIARTIHLGFNSNRHVRSTGLWGIRSEIFDGRQIRRRSRKHFLEMTLLPSTKRHAAAPSLKGIYDNLPPRTISISPWISPRLHLTPFPIPLHRRPPRRSFHCLRTKSAFLSSTISAPELLPRRPLPPHRSCSLHRPIPSTSSFPDDWPWSVQVCKIHPLCTILPVVLLLYGAYSGSVFALVSATSHQPARSTFVSQQISTSH